MIAIDTNILARWALRDDETQFRVAEQVLGQPCWVGWTIWIELGWLLKSVAKLDRGQVCDVLEAIAAISTVHFDRPSRLRWAIARHREAGDLADLMHIASTGDVSAFLSFEKRLARQAGASSPVKIELAM